MEKYLIVVRRPEGSPVFILEDTLIAAIETKLKFGNEPLASLYTCSSEEEAYKIIDTYRIRYNVTTL